MSKRDFMTADQAATELGMDRRSILNAIERGDLPNAQKLDPEKETSAWLIPVSDIEAFKKKRAQSGKD